MKNRFSPKNIGLAFIILIVLFILFRKLTMFFLITLFVAAFTYMNYYIRFPFDVSPVLFLSLIISYEYNFWFSALFIIAAGVVPMVMAGGSFDHTTVFYVSVRLLVNLLNSIHNYPFILSALILSILDHALGLIGGVTVLGANPGKEITNFFLQIIVDLFYIISFSTIIIGLIN